MSDNEFPHRSRAMAWVLLGLLALAVTVPLATSAHAAGPTPTTASPITSLPFNDTTTGEWVSQPAATGAANASVSESCNEGAPMYRVRWYVYTPTATTSIVARGEMYSVFLRDRSAQASGVAILNSRRDVIDCSVVRGGGTVPDPNQAVAVAGPVRVKAGSEVYVVQFVRDNPSGTPCSEVVGCYGAEETISVQLAGSYPISDNWYNAEPITSIPVTRTVDTTLSTQGGNSDFIISCTGTAIAATRTVWWTLTPTITGVVEASVSFGRLAFGKATPAGVVPVQNCAENPTLQAGKRYLLGVGIPEYFQPDDASSGGPVTLTISSGPALGRPDLVVTGVSWSPTAPKAGDPVSFRATIKNQGTAPTQGGVAHGVLFSVDGKAKTWSDTFNGSLAPGASVTVTANGGLAGAATWPATRGSHRVAATVDDVNRVPDEVSESNNTRKASLFVKAAAARPDLVVTGVSWSPADPTKGTLVRFKATVKNQGTKATPGKVVLGVLFNVDGVPVTWSDTSKAALAPGKSRTLKASGGKAGSATWPATAGQHVVEAVVDDINRIKNESDETNNARSVPFNVGAGGSRPDLVVTGVSWKPTAPTAGAPVTFSATVKNVGTRSTPTGTVVRVSFRPREAAAGQTISDTWSTALHPGESVTLTANKGGLGGRWTARAGSTSVLTVVDDGFGIPESNEANNTLRTTIRTR